MKRKACLAALCVLMFAFIFPIHTYAASDSIDLMELTFFLNSDGSVDVTEVWDTYAASGTENYRELELDWRSEVSNLTVYEDGVAFSYVNSSEWPAQTSLSAKANKCTIKKTSKGYEVIWGIGTYDRHKYTVQYTVSNIVFLYDDYASFEWIFMDRWELPTKKINIKIERDGTFAYDKTRLWSFGWDGDLTVSKDGEITGYANKFSSFDHMEFVALMPREWFPYAMAIEGNREQYILSYTGGISDDSISRNIGKWANVIAVAAAVAFQFLIFGIPFIIIFHKFRKNRKEIRKSNSYNSGHPPIDMENTSIVAALACETFGYSIASIMEAYMVHWVSKDYIDVFAIDPSKPMEGKNVAIRLIADELTNEDSSQQVVYRYLLICAGSDRILVDSEISALAHSEYGIRRELMLNNRTLLQQYGYFTDPSRGTVKDAIESEATKKSFGKNFVFFMLFAFCMMFLGPVFAPFAPFIVFAFIATKVVKAQSKVAGAMTPKLKEIKKELRGFAAFLKDYANMPNKTITTAAMWENYLVFACIAGVADAVEKQLERLVPLYTQRSKTRAIRRSSAIRTVRVTVSRSSHSSSGRGGSHSRSGGGGSRGGGGGGRR